MFIYYTCLFIHILFALLFIYLLITVYYVVPGGCDKAGIPITRAEVYSFDERKWGRLPDLPTPRAAAGNNGCIVRNNKLILVGGVTTGQKPLDRVDCYDIGSNKWEHFPPLPIGVVGAYIQLVDDKLYCLGGTDKKNCNQSVVFDFVANEWQELPPKPHPSYSSGGYLYDRKLIMVGGRNGPDPVKAVEAFDLDMKQWEELSPMNSVRVFYSVVGIKNEIFVIGGLIPLVGISKIVEKYDIDQNLWCRIKDLSEMRSDSSYGVIGDHVVVAGGLGGAEGQPTFMKNGECFAHRSAVPQRIPSMSIPRASLTTVAFEGKIAVIGGMGEYGGKGPQNAIEVLKLKGDTI